MAVVHAKGRFGLGEGACACALSALCILRSFVRWFVLCFFFSGEDQFYPPSLL